MTTQTSTESGAQSAKERAAAVGGTAQEQAGQVAGTAKEQAGQVAGTAKDQALEVAGEAKAQARDLVGELKGQVQQQAGTQKDRLTQLLSEFGDELEQMATNGGGNGPATEVVRQVAQRLRGVHSYIDGGDAGTGADIVADVRNFARRRPGTFLLAAAAAGVLAGRATRGAAAARKAEQGSRQGVVDVRDTYSTGTSTGYTAGDYAGTTAGYATGGYGGTAAGAPVTGLERTSDPNLAPTAGPYTDAAGTVYDDLDGPVPTGLGGRDTGSTGTGYEGTR
jgi:uncharacterized protein YjbJ (UPF0337 family)